VGNMEEEDKILVVDDEAKIRELVCRALEGRTLDTAATADEARSKLSDARLVLLDLKLAGDDGMELLNEFRENRPEVPVIIMTAFASIESAVSAMKAGACDYITKPFSSLDDLRLKVDRALREAKLEIENRKLRNLLIEQDSFEEMIGGSALMNKVYNMIDRVADGESTILIEGESGTGKELVARAIHRRSSRQKKSFIEINCAAIPENLLESELFGYEKGAFTGAYKQKKGLFETAQGGTVFLDEIAEMPKELQVKLLRVIEEKSFTRLGGTSLTRIDSRIIAATNRDLKQAVKNGEFREDLYYRLAVIQIALPPLRDRVGDLEKLFKFWVPNVTFEKEAWEIIMSYNWPGNVREVKNFVERINQLGIKRVTVSDLPDDFSGSTSGSLRISGSLVEMVDSYERSIIKQVLEDSNGVRIDAANRLGVTRQALQYKLEKYGLDWKK